MRLAVGWALRTCALLLAGLACDVGEIETFDEGHVVCISGVTEGGALRVRAAVEIGGCWSSSCTTELGQSCAIELASGELTVTAAGAIERTGGDSCTRDCRRLSAACMSEPIAPGVYTVRHAGEAFQIELTEDGQVLPSAEAMAILRCG